MVVGGLWYRVGVGRRYKVWVGDGGIGKGGWYRVGVGGCYRIQVVVSVDLQPCMDALVEESC